LIVFRGSEDLSFSDFDSWVRSRFGIINSSLITYKDSDGDEILPVKSNLHKQEHITVEVTVVKTEAVPIAPKPKPNNSIFRIMYFYMLAPIIVAYAIVQNNNVFAQYIPVHDFCDAMDTQLIQMGIIHKTGVSLEAAIAFICWSTTYLFIRRLWNPETFVGCLERFSADSFYGGLAAAASVILKTYLVAHSSK